VRDGFGIGEQVVSDLLHRAELTRRGLPRCDHARMEAVERIEVADILEVADPMIAHATGLYAARAENAELWDVEGRRYIDFAGGNAVLNTGHRHPKVMRAVLAQLKCYTRSLPGRAPGVLHLWPSGWLL
jgi:4-aminobutyrate aminotransferase-like enzyme